MNHMSTKLYFCVRCEQKFLIDQLQGRIGNLGICDSCSVERAGLDLLFKPKPKPKTSLTVEIDSELLAWVKKEKSPYVALRELVEHGLKEWQRKMLKVIEEESKLKK